MCVQAFLKARISRKSVTSAWCYETHLTGLPLVVDGGNSQVDTRIVSISKVSSLSTGRYIAKSRMCKRWGDQQGDPEVGYEPELGDALWQGHDRANSF